MSNRTAARGMMHFTYVLCVRRLGFVRATSQALNGLWSVLAASHPSREDARGFDIGYQQSFFIAPADKYIEPRKTLTITEGFISVSFRVFRG